MRTNTRKRSSVVLLFLQSFRKGTGAKDECYYHRQTTWEYETNEFSSTRVGILFALLTYRDMMSIGVEAGSLNPQS